MLQQAALLLGVSFVLILNGSTNLLIDSQTLTYSAIVFSILAVTWLLVGQAASNPLRWPLLAWYIIYTITVIASDDPRRSLTQMLLMTQAVFLFSLSADLAARSWSPALWLRTLLIMGALVALVSWLGALTWYLDWRQAMPGRWLPDTLYRPDSANIIAAVMNLILMLTLARLRAAENRVIRIGLILLALAAAGMLFLTSSRGGWLGCVAGLAVLALSGRKRLQSWFSTAWAWLRGKPLRIGLASILVALILIGGGWLLYRQTQHGSHMTIALARSEFWPPAWQAFLSSPMVGTGPFTYSSAFINSNSIPPAPLYIHAHGTLFNLLAEMGLLGLLGMAALVISSAGLLFRRMRTARGSALVGLIAAAASLAALGIHSFVDCFHTEPIALWLFVMILGMALGGTQPLTPARRRPWWVLLVVLALWGDLWLTWPYRQGVEAANRNDWPQAARLFEQAAARDPWAVMPHQQLALANSVLASQGDPSHLPTAINALEQVRSMEPAWPVNAANLGALYTSQGNPSLAQSAWQAAASTAPQSALYQINLGQSAESNLDLKTAEAAYQAALTESPELAFAFFWHQTDFRQQFIQTWLRNNSPLSLTEWEAELAQRPDRLLLLVRVADLYLSADRTADAADLITRAQFAYAVDPTETLELNWLQAELAYRQGNLTQAISLGQNTISTYQLQGIYGPGSFGLLRYGPIMFRRPAMAMELVPQMPLLPVTDTWALRIQRLADWYTESGDLTAAQALLTQLSRQVPADYIESLK